ncbi:DUF551 domain-containing protein [Klebsiella oxytoca]|uniref:DUF551 domain-containing protein n=1 Tax=Klebsiella oxytoca TaxID=571 RepID=UPI001CCF152C|nr:DUF551 domain-containing protein [Klebsiella oxytoca]UWC76422.1 DUF551 domain-containing protein [Klebsiella oxytoca]
MTSKLTREELLNIIETDHVQCGEAAYLARIALAAIDSEPVELPLDYLQGHKDGLEWAAQLAKANHPETGDWLYDDPIELAKAISKGPDMPPSQPALDSEPVCFVSERNLATLTKYRAAVKVKAEPVMVRPVALYRHAQPAPVLLDGLIKAVEFYEQVKRENPPVETGAWKDAVDWVLKEACRAAMLQAGNSPVIPEGWQVEAERLAEMHGMSFVLFRHGEAPQCADPTKVVISFTDKGLGHDTLPAAPQELK